MEPAGRTDKAVVTAAERLRRRRRWSRRRLRRDLTVLGLAGLLLLFLVSALHNRPPKQPYRTPEVAAALERARSRTGPDPGPVVSLSAAPRLALVGPGLGDAKLALELRPLPMPAERPAEAVEAVLAKPPPRPAPPAIAEPASPPPIPVPPAAPRPALQPEPPAPAPEPPPSIEAAVPATPVPPPGLPAPPAPRPAAAAVQPVAVVRPPAPPAAGAPRLAVIIDDLGYDQGAARRAIALPAPVTLAFLPYGFHLAELTAAAAGRGHDVFLHLPIEPLGNEDPGTNALLTGLQPAELARRLAWAFAHVPHAVGVNNHMGSRGTADPALMLAVLSEVRRRGLVFIDSRTTGASVAPAVAQQLGVPIASRDIFLDNVPTAQVVLAQLEAAERVARRHGQAVAIGHPFPATLSVLADWLPAAERRGLRLVTARSLARHAEPCALTVSTQGGC